MPASRSTSRERRTAQRAKSVFRSNRATHSVSSPGLSAQVGSTRLATLVDCATRASPSCGAIPRRLAPCLPKRDPRERKRVHARLQRAKPAGDGGEWASSEPIRTEHALAYTDADFLIARATNCALN